MLLQEDINIFDIYCNQILLEAKDVIKSDDPKELLAKFITGSSLYQSNSNLKKEADSVATSIINQILQTQKEKNSKIYDDKDVMSLVNSLLMMVGSQQYVNQINGDESKVNKNLYNQAFPVLLHDYKDALDNKEELLQNPQFVNMFQKGIPRWMDIVHSLQGKEKHTKQEVKQTKTETPIFENDEVAVYLANDTENPMNGVKRCKEFGKGSNLCISGSNANYHYHDYRWNDKLTTYFCYLKKRGHYMLVDADEDDNLQYNPINHNEEYEVTKEELLKLYPELTEPVRKNVFVSVPITGKELEFYERFQDADSILDFKTSEDRLKFASFKEIKSNEWGSIPKDEWGKILEYAIYVSEHYDIPDYVFEGKPRLYKEYKQNIKRRVENIVKEWNSSNYELDLSHNELLLLKDIEGFSKDFLDDFGDTMWFLALKKDDPRFNKNVKNVVENFLSTRKHEINEKGDVILLQDLRWAFKYVLFPFNLIKCKNLVFEEAEVVLLPQLQESLNIEAPAAKNIDLSELKKVKDINADALILSLPQLQQCADIFVPFTTSLNLPKLQQSGRIDADRVTSLSLPQLQQSDSILAELASNIDLSELKNCSGDINAKFAINLKISKLQTCRNLVASSVKELNLPNLKSINALFAKSATFLNLSELPSDAEIWGGINVEAIEKIIMNKNLMFFIKTSKNKEDIYKKIIEPSSESKLNDSVIYDLFKAFLLTN